MLTSEPNSQNSSFNDKKKKSATADDPLVPIVPAFSRAEVVIINQLQGDIAKTSGVDLISSDALSSDPSPSPSEPTGPIAFHLDRDGLPSQAKPANSELGDQRVSTGGYNPRLSKDLVGPAHSATFRRLRPSGGAPLTGSSQPATSPEAMPPAAMTEKPDTADAGPVCTDKQIGVQPFITVASPSFQYDGAQRPEPTGRFPGKAMQPQSTSFAGLEPNRVGPLQANPIPSDEVIASSNHQPETRVDSPFPQSGPVVKPAGAPTVGKTIAAEPLSDGAEITRHVPISSSPDASQFADELRTFIEVENHGIRGSVPVDHKNQSVGASTNLAASENDALTQPGGRIVAPAFNPAAPRQTGGPAGMDISSLRLNAIDGSPQADPFVSHVSAGIGETASIQRVNPGPVPVFPRGRLQTTGHIEMKAAHRSDGQTSPVTTETPGDVVRNGSDLLVPETDPALPNRIKPKEDGYELEMLGARTEAPPAPSHSVLTGISCEKVAKTTPPAPDAIELTVAIRLKPEPAAVSSAPAHIPSDEPLDPIHPVSHTPELKIIQPANCERATPGFVQETDSNTTPDRVSSERRLVFEENPWGKTATPLRSLSVQISQPGQERVELRVVDRAGELHVALRTQNPELSQGLRLSLPELVDRLHDTGFQAEGWRPGGSTTGDGPGTSHRTSLDSANHEAQAHNQPGWSHSDRNQSEQHRSNRPKWVQDLEDNQTLPIDETLGAYYGVEH